MLEDSEISKIGLTIFLFEEIWTLVLWVRKVVDCFKHCLVNHTRSFQESGTECEALLLNPLSQAPQFLTFGTTLLHAPTHHSCDTLVENVAAFSLIQRVFLRLK